MADAPRLAADTDRYVRAVIGREFGVETTIRWDYGLVLSVDAANHVCTVRMVNDDEYAVPYGLSPPTVGNVYPVYRTERGDMWIKAGGECPLRAVRIIHVRAGNGTYWADNYAVAGKVREVNVRLRAFNPTGSGFTNWIRTAFGTFTAYNGPPGTAVVDIAAADETYMYLATTSGVYLEQRTTPYPFVLRGAPNFTGVDIGGLAPDHYCEAHVYAYSTGGQFARSDDAGATWANKGTIPFSPVIVEQVRPNQFIARANAGGTAVTLDDGVTWTSGDFCDFDATAVFTPVCASPGADGDSVWYSGADSTSAGNTYVRTAAGSETFKDIFGATYGFVGADGGFVDIPYNQLGTIGVVPRNFRFM